MGGAGNWLRYYVLGFQPLVGLISAVIFFCGFIGRAKIFKRLGAEWYQSLIPIWNTLTYGKILGRTDLAAINIVAVLASTFLTVVVTVISRLSFLGAIVALVFSVVTYGMMTIALISQACMAMILVKKFRLNWSLAILYGISWDLGDSIVGLSDYTEGLCVEDTNLGLFGDIKESFEYIRQHMRGYDAVERTLFKTTQNRQKSSNSSFEQEQTSSNSSFEKEHRGQTQSNTFENDARFESQSFESNRPLQSRQTPQNRTAGQSNASLDFDDSFDDIDF